MDTPDVLNIEEAAKFLRVSKRTAYKLAEAKRIPAKKVGGSWRLSRAALEKYLGVPVKGAA